MVKESLLQIHAIIQKIWYTCTCTNKYWKGYHRCQYSFIAHSKTNTSNHFMIFFIKNISLRTHQFQTLMKYKQITYFTTCGQWIPTVLIWNSIESFLMKCLIHTDEMMNTMTIMVFVVDNAYMYIHKS